MRENRLRHSILGGRGPDRSVAGGDLDGGGSNRHVHEYL